MVFVVGVHDKERIDKLTKSEVPIINTTSTSPEAWQRMLSPFYVGPVNLYDGKTSRNMENAWQYVKVYQRYLGEDGEPTPEYFEWAARGWDSEIADRYPMGKNAKPVYSYWDGQHLDYITARKRIYIPLYASAVLDTVAFDTLEEMYNENEHIALWDSDGYDSHKLGMSFMDIVHEPKMKMGHAFVLSMLLQLPEGEMEKIILS